LNKWTAIHFGLFAGMFVLQATETAGLSYLFEGEVTRIENSMAPTLREGQVFSGSFVYGKHEAAIIESGEGIFENALSLGEFTIDQNYVRVYAAEPGDGFDSITLSQGDREAETLDTYGTLLPVKGPQVGEGGWTVRWMQVWLYGDAKQWLSHLKAQEPPEGYLRGWFRLTFWSESLGKEGICEGPITYFGKAGEPLTPAEEIEMLERVVSELGTQLKVSREQQEQLAASLANSRQRVKGLNETIDGLIAEREALKTELRLSQIENGSDEVKAELERLQADEAMWSEMRQAMESQNLALATSLAKSAAERRAMEDELAALHEWKETLVAGMANPPAVNPQVPQHSKGVTIIEIPAEAIVETVKVMKSSSDSARTKPGSGVDRVEAAAVEAPIIEVKVAPEAVEAEEPSKEEAASAYYRARGPSKFRGRRF